MEKAQGLIVNDVVIEVPKPATEDTLGTVTLTDDFTYTGAEEHLAVTPKAALLFKQKLDDLVTTGGGMYVRAPTITAPTGDDVAISGAVITASAFAPLVQGATRYNRRFELSKTEDFAEIVWSVAKNEDSAEIGVVLENDVDYYVRVKDFCVEGYVSPWSNVHKFNTATGIPATTPTVTVKEQNIFKSVTLIGSAFAMSDGSSATHQYTDWKIYQGHNLIWSSLQDPTNLVQITTPEILSENTSYSVEVRYYPNTGLPSAVGTTTFSTEADFGHVLTPTLTVTLKDGLASVPIKVSASAFAVSVGSDTHRATTWKLYKSEDLSTPVWESVEDESNLTSIAIPADRNTTYKITCQFHGTKLGDSAVGEAVCTTNNILIEENYIGIPGTSTFGVGLAPKEVYESLGLEKMPNTENTEHFQFALYHKQGFSMSSDAPNGAKDIETHAFMKYIPLFYWAPLFDSTGTALTEEQLKAYLPYVEVTLDQMKKAQSKSSSAVVIAPSKSFSSVKEANSHGFIVMSGFYDGGNLHQGVFVANTLTCQYHPQIDSSGTVKNKLQSGDKIYFGCPELSNDHVALMNGISQDYYGNTILEDNASFSRASNEKFLIMANECFNSEDALFDHGYNWSCMSVYVLAIIRMLVLAQAQYATDAHDCAWLSARYKAPLGIDNKNVSIDNNFISNIGDQTGASIFTNTAETTDKLARVFVDGVLSDSGSDTPLYDQINYESSLETGYRLCSHNGNITGIYQVAGFGRVYCTGIYNKYYTNQVRNAILWSRSKNIDHCTTLLPSNVSWVQKRSYWDNNPGYTQYYTDMSGDLWALNLISPKTWGKSVRSLTYFGSDYGFTISVNINNAIMYEANGHSYENTNGGVFFGIPYDPAFANSLRHGRIIAYPDESVKIS